MTSARSARCLAGLGLAALAAVGQGTVAQAKEAQAASPAAEVRPGPGTAVASCPTGDVGYRSPSALSHYLEARLAGLRGDHAREAEELRLALAFDEGSAELRASHAAALAAAGRIEAAEAEARLAVACDGAGRASSSSHLLLGRILLARQQVEPALIELRETMKIETALAAGGAPGDPEAWRLTAGLRVEADDLAGAAATLEAAVGAVGTDGGGFRELAQTMLERRQLEAAERAARRAIDLDRGDLEAWRLLAQLDEGLRHREQARADWMALLRLDPENPDALLGLGRLALLDDDLAAGEEWFRRHLRVAGDGPEPRLRVAFEWLEVRRPERALRVARDGLASSPAEPRLQLVAGLALQELRRWRESAAVLGEVAPGAGELWFSARAAMAESLSRAGQHDEALAALAPLMSARPGEPRLVSQRAAVLIRMGRGVEAVELLSDLRADRARLGDQAALLEIEPSLADARLRTGHAGEAVAGLRRAVEAQPTAPALRLALGTALETAGQPDEAEVEMRALLKLDPENAEALNFIGYRYAELGERLDEAEALLRRALVVAPRSGHIVDSMGWLMLRKGDTRRAIELLEQAAGLMGPDPAVLEHLGDAYRAAGRTAEAVAAWRRALGSFGDEPLAEQLRLRASLERKLSGVVSPPHKPMARPNDPQPSG